MKKITKIMGLFLLAGVLVFTGCQKIEQKADDLEEKIDDLDDKNDHDDHDDYDEDIDKDITVTDPDEEEAVLATVHSFVVDAAGEITGPTTGDYSSISEKSKDLVTVLDHRNAFLQGKLDKEGNLDIPVDDLDLDIEQIVIVNDEALVEVELDVELTNGYEHDDDYFILLEKENNEWKVVNFVSEDDIYIEKYYDETSVSKAHKLQAELKADDHKRNIDEIKDLLREINYDTSETNLENIQKSYN